MLQNLLHSSQPKTGVLRRLKNLWVISGYDLRPLGNGDAILKKPYKPNKKLATIIEL